ncbi:MAG: nucleotide exchange factor GrpE [Arachnia sp.]
MSEFDESTEGEEGQTPPPTPKDAADSPAEGSLVGDAVDEAFAESTIDWASLAAERTADLQRLQAEYVNYKRRVDRDRALSRQSGIESVVIDLMPVMDTVSLARTHDDLGAGFKMVADELEKVTTKHGLVSFGEVGDVFDPNRHDALMEVPLEGTEVEVTTISQVMQQGYALGDRVIRPARVGVANPKA